MSQLARGETSVLGKKRYWESSPTKQKRKYSLCQVRSEQANSLLGIAKHIKLLL